MLLNCDFLMDNDTEILNFAFNSWDFENTGLFSLKLSQLSSFFMSREDQTGGEREEKGKGRNTGKCR